MHGNTTAMNILFFIISYWPWFLAAATVAVAIFAWYQPRTAALLCIWVSFTGVIYSVFQKNFFIAAGFAVAATMFFLLLLLISSNNRKARAIKNYEIKARNLNEF